MKTSVVSYYNMLACIHGLVAMPTLRLCFVVCVLARELDLTDCCCFLEF